MAWREGSFRAVLSYLLFLTSFLSHTTLAQSPRNPDDPAWGCYDPEPGHPTAAERTAYFEKIKKFAQLAEQKDGVPAAGLAAMSMEESGYGFTRTAQFAHNVFGWKAPETQATSYILTCQPANDRNNHYQRFANYAEAFQSVGRGLGNCSRNTKYVDATRTYAQERAKGVTLNEAVLHWIQGLQRGGYNPDPHYVDRVIRLANDYQSPSDTSSATLNLYQLSQFPPPPGTSIPKKSATESKPDEIAALLGRLNPRLGPPPNSLPDDKVAELTKFFDKQQPYLREHCTETAVKGYETIPRSPEKPMRCEYQVRSTDPKAKTPLVKTATALVIFPSAQRISRWIVDSCLWAAAGDFERCVAFLATGCRGVIEQSSAQFPVAGIVFEDMTAGLMKGYAFRDGLTVKVAGWDNGSEDSPNDRQTKAALENVPTWTSTVARIARADIHDVKCLDPKAEFNPESRDQRWRNYVRKRFVEALQGDHNLLFLAQVFAYYHPEACAPAKEGHSK
jgi:Mannosyl-glycoprotein endo-beta-N-acetylglucosaminidase